MHIQKQSNKNYILCNYLPPRRECTHINDMAKPHTLHQHQKHALCCWVLQQNSSTRLAIHKSTKLLHRPDADTHTKTALPTAAGRHNKNSPRSLYDYHNFSWQLRVWNALTHSLYLHHHYHHQHDAFTKYRISNSD